MKNTIRRRDFLGKSSIIAAYMATPNLGYSLSAPCAPPNLNVTGGTSVMSNKCPLPSLPYTLPSPGAAVLIGSNTAAQIKPATITSNNWAYSLFNSYGCGSFNPDYSAIGAFVIAGTGGHNAPPNIDAAIFDFTDAKWKLIKNSNGIVARDIDFSVSEVSSDSYKEIIAAIGKTPAPSHVYATSSYLPGHLGGGPQGSFIKIAAIGATPSALFGLGSHRMDLATGTWSRLTNDLVDWGYTAEGSVVFDPISSRYFVIPDSFHRLNYLEYIDIATGTIKKTTAYPSPADYTSSGYQTTILDPVRRLILNQRPGWPLRALDLNDISSGWRTLTTSGTQPSDANRWAFYEPDGRLYTRGNKSGQTLVRLTPPNDWKNGTWQYDNVTITGAALPDFTNTGGNNSRHYGTFFYVPEIQSLAWISGESTQVALIKPPIG